MSRCIIITSFQSASLREFFAFRRDDFIICADGGYFFAKAEDIKPQMIIGDFDSIDVHSIEEDLEGSELDGSCRIVRVEEEKDDTDTMICLRYGIDQGFQEFYVLGGLGGRLDHIIANLQTMSYAVDRGISIWFLDGKNRATLRNPGKLAVSKINGYKISLFAFGDQCEGVSIRGVKYPLENYLLKNHFPIGVSNEFYEYHAEISHETGKLLIVLSHD